MDLPVFGDDSARQVAAADANIGTRIGRPDTLRGRADAVFPDERLASRRAGSRRSARRTGGRWFPRSAAAPARRRPARWRWRAGFRRSPLGDPERLAIERSLRRVRPILSASAARARRRRPRVQSTCRDTRSCFPTHFGPPLAKAVPRRSREASRGSDCRIIHNRIGWDMPSADRGAGHSRHCDPGSCDTPPLGSRPHGASSYSPERRLWVDSSRPSIDEECLLRLHAHPEAAVPLPARTRPS